MSDYYVIHNGELYHYGRKGMKWGQHIFGKIKASISTRRSKIKEEREAARKAENERRIMKTPNRKLTVEELKWKAGRLKAEKEVADLQKQLKETQWDELSKGQKFIRTVGKEVVKPAAINASRQLLQNYLQGVGGVKVGKLINEFKDKNNAAKQKNKSA